MRKGLDYEHRVAHLQEEILDVKQTLAGNHGTKRATLLLIELERLEGDLKAVTQKRENNAPSVTRGT